MVAPLQEEIPYLYPSLTLTGAGRRKAQHQAREIQESGTSCVKKTKLKPVSLSTARDTEVGWKFPGWLSHLIGMANWHKGL